MNLSNYVDYHSIKLYKYEEGLSGNLHISVHADDWVLRVAFTGTTLSGPRRRYSGSRWCQISLQVTRKYQRHPVKRLRQSTLGPLFPAHPRGEERKPGFVIDPGAGPGTGKGDVDHGLGLGGIELYLKCLVDCSMQNFYRFVRQPSARTLDGDFAQGSHV
jgi:hypothetical protein